MATALNRRDCQRAVGIDDENIRLVLAKSLRRCNRGRPAELPHRPDLTRSLPGAVGLGPMYDKLTLLIDDEDIGLDRSGRIAVKQQGRPSAPSAPKAYRQHRNSSPNSCHCS